MPSASSASLRPISWVTIDLTLTTSSTPWALAIEATIALASAASRAQCTVAPLAVSDASSSSSWLPRSRSADSLTPGAGEPQLLPVAVLVDLVDQALPLGADGAGGVREVVPQLGVAECLVRGDGELRHPDEGAAASFRRPPGSRPGARCVRRTAGGVSRPPMWVRQELSPATSTSAPVSQTCRALSAPIATDVSAFFTREGAAEAAALVGALELEEGDPADLLEQLPRPLAHAEHAQRVAGRVVGDGVRVVGADVGHAEHVDEELRQLVDLRRRLRHRRLQAPRHPSAARRSSAGAGRSRRTTRTASRPRRTPRTCRRSCVRRAPPRRGSRC